MSSTWVTSDWHLNHKNVIDFCKRPYGSVEEMNDALVANHNAFVRPGDTVYHLGDIALGNLTLARPWIERLNGYRVAIKGNHDASKQKLLDAGFHNAMDQHYVVVGGLTFWLAHVPTHNESDKRNLRRPQAVIPYDVALCGHVHEKWLAYERNLNIGCDVWRYRPVCLDALASDKTLPRVLERGLIRHEPGQNAYEVLFPDFEPYEPLDRFPDLESY